MSLSRAQNIFMPADINSIEIRDMLSFELSKEIYKGAFFVLSRARDKKNSESPRGIEPCPTLVTKRKKKPFSISLPSSKPTIPLISIYKHYAIDIADPTSMQGACYMNFVIDFAHRGVFVAQWLEHRSAESEGLRPFDSSWGLRIFSLSRARDKTKETPFSINSFAMLYTMLLNE